ncbi:MAG: AAA-like domain-containing protein [Prevotellaceae bacterium]|nr:AAA-like domain-containing protein [Prevotellaceae bacterium]
MVTTSLPPKIFNTAGPIKPEIHYCVDPLTRFNLSEIESLIEYGKYFVLHAPRQTGKTSCMLALRDYLNRQGRYYAVYANIEAGQASRNHVDRVIQGVVANISSRLCRVLGNKQPDEIRLELVKTSPTDSLLSDYLSTLSQTLDRPLILFIDEIDALVGDSLVSVLRQIRSGYDDRPAAFPQSVVLCGVRDVRDYRIVQSNQEIITGGSAFNIKAESLRLGNFSREEIHTLYMQHTQATGQVFDDACFPMVWEATEGQPWLVNALAYEVTSRMVENRDRTVSITTEMMFRAKENIIYRRETHIDILIDKLREPRVRNVIAPILANEDGEVEGLLKDDDIQYVVDLGLIVRDKPLRIANGIYKEVIPRELTAARQDTLIQQAAWYMNPDNSINMEKLLLDFQQFFRQNADAWIERFDYKESGPQLLLQAFLQRVVNGGGYIDREYGLGRQRTDLLIRKPLTDGYGGPIQYIVLELKIKRGEQEAIIAKGLEQTTDYMDKAAPTAEGHFILFNRDKGVAWEDKIWHRKENYGGRTITVWGM